MPGALARAGAAIVLVAALLAPAASPDAAAASAGAVPRGGGVRGVGGRLWPVPLRPAVSSNFCEYREGHLHAGIDVRTFGRTGVPCRAPEAGWVSRVRASFDGYGRALYVHTRSGRTLVFAHLDEFMPAVERRVREVQEAGGRYRVDLRLPPRRIRVAAGDTVGWSGRTGTEAPHLHFEVRDAGEHPLNPFREGYAPPDTTAPVFGRVRLVPLGPDAAVAGACLPGEWPARPAGGARWTIDGPIVLRGPVGVEVEVHDTIDPSSGRLAPHRLGLDVDGRTLTELTLERFRFGHTDQVEFLYDMAAVRNEHAWFYLLYDRPGAAMWGRHFAQGGRLGVGPPGAGTHRVGVRAVDAAGNVARLEFDVVFEAPGDVAGASAARAAHPALAPASPVRPTTDGFGLWALDGLLCARRGRGAAAATWSDAGAVRVDGEAWVATAASLGAMPRRLPLAPGPGAPVVEAVGLRAGQARSVRFADLGVELVVSARSLWGDQVLWLSNADTRRAEGDAAIVERSRRVRLGPASLSLRADVELRFTGVTWDSTDAIYRLDDRRPRWSFYASTRDGDVIVTTVRRPGVYAVLRDATPPVLRRAFVRRRRRWSDGARVAEIVVPVDDALSGVDAERCRVRVDGRDRVFRWDFVDKKLFVELDGGNIIGTHRVEVEAFDRAGNRARRVDVVGAASVH